MLMTTGKYDECFLRAGNILFLDLGAGHMRMLVFKNSSSCIPPIYAPELRFADSHMHRMFKTSLLEKSYK